LNEAGCIRNLVKETLAQPVDDGSTDGTPDVAWQAGAHGVSESRRGCGYACAAGATATVDADDLVFLDGDDSFLPSEMSSLLAPVVEGRAEEFDIPRFFGIVATWSDHACQRFSAYAF